MAVRLGGKVDGQRYVSSIYVPFNIPDLGSLVYIAKTNNSITVMYMPEGLGILSVVVKGFSEPKPTDSEFDFSLHKQTLNATGAVQLVHTSVADPNKVTMWVQLNNGTSRATTSISLEYLLESIDSFFATNF